MTRKRAAIVDMDGTLCNVSSVRHFVVIGDGRTEKDFDAFHEASAGCPPNQQALDFCQRHHDAGDVIVVVTARMERHYKTSKTWLDTYMTVPYDGPIMRPDGLVHTDVSVKSRIYNYLIRHYDIRAACDDNPAIVALWEKFGIPVEVIPGWDHQ